MRVSTRGIYALQAMTLLAAADHRGETAVSISALSEASGISPGYLEQIFLLLKRDGILQGLRGISGGYRLARPSRDISAGEILRAVEGPLTPVKCLSTQDCTRADFCMTRGLWARMLNVTNRVADSITLDQLARSLERAQAAT